MRHAQNILLILLMQFFCVVTLAATAKSYQVVLSDAAVKPTSVQQALDYVIVCSDASRWVADVQDLAAVLYWQRGDRLQIECLEAEDNEALCTARNIDRTNRSVTLRPLDHEITHLYQQEMR